MNDIHPQNSADSFDSLLRWTHRDNIDDLINWLHTTDFYVAPASTKYHGACERGLIMHSLSVCDCAIVLNKALELNINYDSIRICALLHDVCKVNCYEEYDKNTKVTNKETGVSEWTTTKAYIYNDQFPFGGHGSKSVYLISHFINLTQEEAAAINCHMAAWDNPHYSVGNVYEKYKLAWLIHVADEMSTFLYGV